MSCKLRLMLVGLGSALAISGCATLSRDDCLMGDWYEIGVQDGAAGYAPDRLAQHREACAEYRIRPDREAYQAGWDDGIGIYCTPERGYQEGRRGASYGQVCPPPLEWAFLQGYRNGQQLYQQERRLRELEQEQERNKKEIRKRDEERRKADEQERNKKEIRKRDEERRKVDEDERQRYSPPAVERSRSEYRQIQPVPTPSPISEERAKQEKQRNEIEQIKRQIQQMGEQAKPADTAQ